MTRKMGFQMARNPDADEPIDFDRAQRIETAMRSFVAGHPQGAVRRTFLYIASALAMLTLAVLSGLAGVIVGGIGLAALMVLANSDELL